MNTGHRFWSSLSRAVEAEDADLRRLRVKRPVLFLRIRRRNQWYIETHCDLMGRFESTVDAMFRRGRLLVGRLVSEAQPWRYSRMFVALRGLGGWLSSRSERLTVVLT